MKARFKILALAAVVVLANPAPAAAPVKGAPNALPPMTLQIAPVGTILKSLRAAATLVGGEMAAKTIDDGIKMKLGEKGFEGLALDKPILGYVNLTEKPFVKPEDYKNASGMLMVPFTTEEGLKSLLVRLNENDPLKLVPVEGNAGLYVVTTPKGDAEFPIRLRFHDGHACFGFNVKDDAMEPGKLLAAASVTVADERGLVCLRTYTNRYPEEWKKDPAKQLENAFEEAKKNTPLPPEAKEFMDAYLKMVGRFSTQMTQEGEESAVRVLFEETSAEVALEMTMTGLKGTPLAADIAGRKPSQNKFGGLIPADAIGGFTTKLPLFTDELREMAVKGIEKARTSSEEGSPEGTKEFHKELFDGLTRTIKTGQFDLAGGVTGPNKDGHYTATFAVAFEDSPKLEAALKKTLPNLPIPGAIKNGLKLDVDKIGETAVHEFTPPEDAPPPIQKIFGTNKLLFVFGPKGVFASYGIAAKDALTAALAAKPVDAKVLDIVVNPKKLGALITISEPNAGEMAKKMLGDTDKLMSAAYLSVDGGSKLTMRLAVNLRLLPRAMGGAAQAP